MTATIFQGSEFVGDGMPRFGGDEANGVKEKPKFLKKEFGLAPIVSNLICIQRLSKTAGKGKSTENEHDYRFISEKENSALIAYRKFLVTAGEINEYDVSKRNIGLYTPTEDGQQKGIFLPTLFNIFGRISLERTKDNKMFEQRQNITRHNKWRCIFCANKQYQIWPEEIAYAGQSFEVISLIDRLANKEIGTANSNNQIAKLLRLFRDGPTALIKSVSASLVLALVGSMSTNAAPEAKDQVKSGLLLNVVVGHRAAIFELFAGKDQPLLIRRDALLVLDLRLHVVNCVRTFHLQ
uniref:SPOC domain-containing protein n=1 Tax=Globodera pallida TaxID=36090 RepID=A0A183BV07_GLOPA